MKWQKIMKTIIDKNISSLEFIELRDYMQMAIHESLVMAGKEHIMWYEDCTMEDYFTMWQEIYDELGTKIGEGLDTIAHEFILNDDTRADFESAFEEARDAAFEERIKDIIEEVEEYEQDEDIKSIDIDDSLTEEEQRLLKEQDEYIELAGDDAEITYTPSEFVADHINEEIDKLEQRGYKKVASDSDNCYDFYVDSDLCNKLVEEGCSVEKVAQWLGATVVVIYQGSDDYQKTWLK